MLGMLGSEGMGCNANGTEGIGIDSPKTGIFKDTPGTLGIPGTAGKLGTGGSANGIGGIGIANPSTETVGILHLLMK